MYIIENLISKKRNLEAFTKSEIEFIVSEYTLDSIKDKEMTLWLNAVFDYGMNNQETHYYTDSMINSGVSIDFSHLDGFVVDKHSTGGVGDKVSIILAPILAACGLYVPMIAGRGLEHTGGTIDKLESIPGYKTNLSIDEFKYNVENFGLSIMAQTKDICPADKKIYALRDITNTVASLPLICGSIMSKKIAEGIKGLVLDIKVGNGAFIKTIGAAKNLSKLLKEVGESNGLKVEICFTDMNQPLGRRAGIWPEIIECMESLKGHGPNDLMKIVYYLGEKALNLGGIKKPKEKMESSIKDGHALEKFKNMVLAHGGDFDSLEHPDLYKPKYIKSIRSGKKGFITFIDTYKLGLSLVHLGGGRIQKTDILDSSVGMNFHKKIGDYVNEGDLLMEYFCNSKKKIESVNISFEEFYEINPVNKKFQPLIY